MIKAKKYSLTHWVKQNVDLDHRPQDVLGKAFAAFCTGGGDHPEIAWSDGNVHAFHTEAAQFANDLYAEMFRKRPVYNGAYFTPATIAYQLFNRVWQWTRENMRGAATVWVYDPCAGIGNLLLPFLEHGGNEAEVGVERPPLFRPFGDELDPHWADIAGGLGLNVKSRDVLAGGRMLLEMPPDVVVINPPFGNMEGHSDIAVDFMHYVADLRPQVVGAILPAGFLEKSAKRYRELKDRFRPAQHIDAYLGAFKPLAGVNVQSMLLFPK